MEGDPEAGPPIGGSWRNLHAAVLILLVGLIGAFLYLGWRYE
jgi:hypothetical protein